MTDELGDQLPGLGIPHPHYAFGAATGQHGATSGQRIYRAFFRLLIRAIVDLQCLAAAMEIPQNDFVIQSARRDPRSALARRCKAFHVVRMATKGDREVIRFGMRAPDAHSGIRRRRHERGVVLRQNDVIDPMAMSLHLMPECCRTGLALLRRKVQIPRANYPIAAGGVSISIAQAVDQLSQFGNPVSSKSDPYKIELSVSTARPLTPKR